MKGVVLLDFHLYRKIDICDQFDALLDHGWGRMPWDKRSFLLSLSEPRTNNKLQVKSIMNNILFPKKKVHNI